MSMRVLFTAVFCLTVAAIIGCQPQQSAPATPVTQEPSPPAEEVKAPAEAAAPAAEETKAPTEAAKPAAETPSSGKCLKGKVMAVNMAAEAKDLAKMQAAAKEACAAMGKHMPKDPELCKKPDFQKMQGCTVAAIKKVAEAKTADEAAVAASAIMPTCKACHMLYKPKPASK